MNEPLKGKPIYNYDELKCKTNIFICSGKFVDLKDIKSAVEWLKEELDKIEDNGEGGYGPDCLSPYATHKLIDKAFEDVTINSGKEGKK